MSRDPIQVLQGLSVSFNRMDQTRPSAIDTLESLRTDLPVIPVKVLSTDYVLRFHNMKKVVSSVTAATLVFGISAISFADDGNYHPPHEAPVNIPAVQEVKIKEPDKRIQVSTKNDESVSKPESVPASAPRSENVPVPQTELKESKATKISKQESVSKPESVSSSAPRSENVPVPQTVKEPKSTKAITTPKRESVSVPASAQKTEQTEQIMLQQKSLESQKNKGLPTEKQVVSSVLVTSLAPTKVLGSETKNVATSQKEPLMDTKQEAIAQLSKLSTGQTTAQNTSKVESNKHETTYIVKKGDTLWALAEKYYGDGALWTKIWDENKEMLIKADLRNEKDHGHWIFPGQNLKIPKK